MSHTTFRTQYICHLQHCNKLLLILPYNDIILIISFYYYYIIKFESISIQEENKLPNWGWDTEDEDESKQTQSGGMSEKLNHSTIHNNYFRYIFYLDNYVVRNVKAHYHVYELPVPQCYLYISDFDFKFWTVLFLIPLHLPESCSSIINLFSSMALHLNMRWW